MSNNEHDNVARETLGLTMQVPRLARGKGYKGPEAFGCFNTGLAPAIFHSRSGKYIVGPELRCRDTMREGLLLGTKRVAGKGGNRVYIYKTRQPAVAKFQELCGAQMQYNAKLRQELATLRSKAQQGDMTAVLDLINF